ncbi:MAG: diguanylate cyclase, partial [Desulfotomaculaceae bacterium]|nr:diguanylate cyclase [Desulfotomaculaceae bacterium]
MKDADKTKEQLINELVEMRQKIADCEALETRHKQKADEFREYRDHLEQLIEERTVELKAAKERLLQEIDERKRVEETTRTTIRQLFDIINFLPDPIFAIDIDRKVTVWNRAIREMTGVHWKDIVGKSDYAYAFYNKSRPLLIDLILSDKTEAEIHEHVGRMGDLLTIERYAPAAYGGKGAFLWGIAAPLYDRDGNLVGAIESIRDITEQRLLQRQLKYLGLHDSLTGLYNRAYFDQEVLRLEGGRHAPVGIIVCDVNGLKFVNDTLGHEFGDNLLKVAANAIKVSFRAGDVVARIGGDEFAVILPNSDRLTVKNGVQRIRDKIARYNLAKEGLPLPLSLSVGFAVCEEASINMDDLFKEADDNMYLEKMYHKQSTRKAIVQALSRVMEARDFTAQGHAERVQNLVADIAAAIDLSEQQT